MLLLLLLLTIFALETEAEPACCSWPDWLFTYDCDIGVLFMATLAVSLAGLDMLDLGDASLLDTVRHK